MIGYIKDRNTFATLDMMLDITEYDLILGSTNNNVGTALVLGELEGLENQFFITENRLWLIKGLSPQDGATTITLNDISFLFSRDLVWDENNNYSTIEECIADTIDAEYINLTDAMYDTPYITVTYSTATGFIKPDVEGGLWNLKGYIAKVRRMKNVFLTYSISGDQLNIDIEAKVPAVHKIDFATDAAQMVQETYQKNSVAKITVNGTTDYYLYSDGTYGTNPSPTLPITRVEGEWVQLSVNSNEVEADKVADTFAKNAESHIVEFWTDLEAEFYDTVIIRHDGRVTSGTLSMVSISSGDNRRYCKTGDLIDTMPVAISVLSERIEKVTKTVERSTSDNIQGDLHVSGDIYEGGVKLEDKYAPIGFNGGDIYTVVAGATGEITAYIAGGFMTDSSTRMYFSVHLPYSMANVTPSITSLKMNVRHVGGGYATSSSYVSGGLQVVGVSGYTVTCTKVNDYDLTIGIAHTRFNGTSNTPVGLEVDELIISFS